MKSGEIIILQPHEMNAKNGSKASTPRQQQLFPQKKTKGARSDTKCSGISLSVDLMYPSTTSTNPKDSLEFHTFNDRNLRSHHAPNRPHLEKPNINLFRKQKKIKWLEILNEEQDVPLRPIQYHAGKQQNTSPAPLPLSLTTQDNTFLHHRSHTQAISRQIHRSAVRRQQFQTKKNTSSTRFQDNKRETSFDRYVQQNKKQIPQQQIKFQIQAKPVMQRITAHSKKKTQQEIKRIFSPSKIFHKASKSSRQSFHPQEEVNFFKAWQLQDDNIRNEIEDYTQQLFSSETLDLRPGIKSPPRLNIPRRK